VGMITSIVFGADRVAVRRSRHDWRDQLRGRVLPIGGLKEKLLAAFAAVSRPCSFPRERARSAGDSDNVKKGLEIVPCRDGRRVLAARW